jgi:hypothetical protein
LLVRHIKLILILTGLVTLLASAAFLLPELFQSLNHVTVGDDTARLFLRHWELEVGCIGGLPLYAAFNAAGRAAILVAAIVGKAGHFQP